jgi:branched-chain amino acid transport system substrate-binding protein
MKRGLFLLITILLILTPTLAQEGEDMPVMGFWEECETPENLPEAVNLGVLFSVSGPIAVYGNPQQQAAELAAAEINEAGYLGEGVELVIVFEDATSDAEGAIAGMTKLVEEAGVVAVIGPTLSTHAFSADPIAQENGVPVMGVSNTAGGITDMGDFVFRNSLPEADVIPGTIARATEVLGLEKVGVLWGSDDDFTASAYEVFIEALEANGVEVVAEAEFFRGDVDFNAQLTTLIDADPDALVVSALLAEAVQITTQARELGYEGPIIGGNGFNSPALMEQAGEAAEGVIVGAAWNIASDNPLSTQFVEAFEEATGNPPDQFAAQSYTGVWLMATAIRCADSVEGEAIRDALAAIQDFPSPLGNYSFDENRNPVHEPIVQIVVDGKFAVLGAEEEGGESQSPTTPQAGHWEGDPSVAFDVAADGTISNFTLTAKFVSQDCVFNLPEVTVDTASMTLLDIEQSFEGEPEPNAQKITIAFDSPTSIGGTYYLDFCAMSDGGFMVGVKPYGVRSGEWTAEWKSE